MRCIWKEMECRAIVHACMEHNGCIDHAYVVVITNLPSLAIRLGFYGQHSSESPMLETKQALFYTRALDPSGRHHSQQLRRRTSNNGAGTHMRAGGSIGCVGTSPRSDLERHIRLCRSLATRCPEYPASVITFQPGD